MDVILILVCSFLFFFVFSVKLYWLFYSFKKKLMWSYSYTYYFIRSTQTLFEVHFLYFFYVWDRLRFMIIQKLWPEIQYFLQVFAILKIPPLSSTKFFFVFAIITFKCPKEKIKHLFRPKWSLLLKFSQCLTYRLLASTFLIVFNII